MVVVVSALDAGCTRGVGLKEEGGGATPVPPSLLAGRGR